MCSTSYIRSFSTLTRFVERILKGACIPSHECIRYVGLSTQFTGSVRVVVLFCFFFLSFGMCLSYIDFTLTKSMR